MKLSSGFRVEGVFCPTPNRLLLFRIVRLILRLSSTLLEFCNSSYTTFCCYTGFYSILILHLSIMFVHFSLIPVTTFQNFSAPALNTFRIFKFLRLRLGFIVLNLQLLLRNNVLEYYNSCSYSSFCKLKTQIARYQNICNSGAANYMMLLSFGLKNY